MSEQFSCRTEAGTIDWFRGQATLMNYYYADKPSVSTILENIKDGTIQLHGLDKPRFLKVATDSSHYFNCRTEAGTLVWFQNFAYKLGYIRGDKGMAGKLLDAIRYGHYTMSKQKPTV